MHAGKAVIKEAEAGRESYLAGSCQDGVEGVAQDLGGIALGRERRAEGRRNLGHVAGPQLQSNGCQHSPCIIPVYQRYSNAEELGAWALAAPVSQVSNHIFEEDWCDTKPGKTRQPVHRHAIWSGPTSGA